MNFTASIHTGCHTPLSLQSRSCGDRIKRYFDQSVIGARVERDCQCEHWPQSSYGSAGLDWGWVAGSICLPRCLHHVNEESTGETEAGADYEWREECECTGIWPYREWSVSRAWSELWCKSGLILGDMTLCYDDEMYWSVLYINYTCSKVAIYVAKKYSIESRIRYIISEQS